MERTKAERRKQVTLDELFKGTFLEKLTETEPANDFMLEQSPTIKNGEKVIGEMTDLEKRLYVLHKMSKAELERMKALHVAAKCQEEKSRAEWNVCIQDNITDAVREMMYALLHERLYDETPMKGLGIRKGGQVVLMPEDDDNDGLPGLGAMLADLRKKYGM